ncbi:MAG: Na+/H+ antiporter subunit E [Pseudomonadota bacterium]
MADSHFKTALGRAVLFALFWWALTEGDGAWWFGLPMIAIAVAASLALMPVGARLWRPAGLVHFLGFFLWHSLEGGIDVARRALHPRLPLAPVFVTYPLRLSEAGACVFLANTISLLPGTLSAELEGRLLRVHVLDRSLPVMRMLEAVEERVAGLFGASLSMVPSKGEIE